MRMTAAQQEIWQAIVLAYRDWDHDRHELMPVRELSSRLNGIAPNAIGAVLAEASAQSLAEVDSIAENPSFRLLGPPA